MLPTEPLKREIAADRFTWPLRGTAPCLALLLLLLCAPATAAESASKLDDLSWLVGAWLGEGLGGTVEEVWAPARDGAMVGTFRLIRDGKTSFYEIMLLAELDGGVELRIKHFHPDLTGWEEKDDFITFRLESTEPGIARFSGLVFRQVEGGMEIDLDLRQRDGKVRTELLRYRRVELEP